MSILAELEKLFKEVFGTKEAQAAIATAKDNPTVQKVTDQVNAAHDAIAALVTTATADLHPEVQKAGPVIVEIAKQVAIASATAAIQSELQK